MNTTFKQALAFTLKYEGGWSDHPKDPDGATMKGITLATFRRFKPAATKAQLRAITDDMVERVYRVDYWQPIDANALARGLDACAFDYAVNSGVGRARKALKAVDGLAAVPAIKKMCASRMSFLRALKTWATFGKGWTRRVTALEAFCLSLAGGNLKKEVAIAETNRAAAAATGAGAAGGAGAVTLVPDDTLLPWSWPLGVLVAALVLIAVVSAWHAYVNSKRRQALSAEIIEV